MKQGLIRPHDLKHDPKPDTISRVIAVAKQDCLSVRWAFFNLNFDLKSRPFTLFRNHGFSSVGRLVQWGGSEMDPDGYRGSYPAVIVGVLSR